MMIPPARSPEPIARSARARRLTAEDEQLIRDAAEHLRAFVGAPPSAPPSGGRDV
jgi:hypothetical protein